MTPLKTSEVRVLAGCKRQGGVKEMDFPRKTVERLLGWRLIEHKKSETRRYSGVILITAAGLRALQHHEALKQEPAHAG